MKKKNSKAIQYIVMFSIFITGLVLGILLKSFQPIDNIQYKQRRVTGYEYINPLVDFEIVEPTTKGELKEIERALNAYVENRILKEKSFKNISIYFQSLNSGAWVGVNEKDTFSPASLLKVPLMIVHYKIAEDDSNYLQQEIVYEKGEESSQNFLPQKELVEGNTYTLDELINQLILYSDNAVIEETGSLLLVDESVDILFSDLGVPNPFTADSYDAINVKDYAGFFRILYNASYLNKEMSSKALKLLSETAFDIGLSAGIPTDVKLANKFGERSIGKDLKELHDCGIIYHSSKPYLLCVMTRGTDFTLLTDSIKEISSIVYNLVDSNK